MSVDDSGGEERTALLTFPECDDAPWHDTMEGGQYVMLVVPTPENHDDNCCVDVSTYLRLPKPVNRFDTVMSYPDVCHTPNELWSRDGYLNGFKESGEVYRHFAERDDERLARWAIQAYTMGQFSEPVLASILLGSDGQSRYSNAHGGYWVASHHDLTFRGKLMYDTLRSLYRVEPLLLTFLDT
jgi:hypothetical protein